MATRNGSITPPGPFGSFKQIPNTLLIRRGESQDGTLYLSQHHLIFSYIPLSFPSLDTKPRPRQLWITYPIISHAALRLSATPRQRSAIRLQCRDFTFLALQFASDVIARETFDKIRVLTCELPSIEKLLAFSYRPPPEEERCGGWGIYDARKEYARMGIGTETGTGWRVSDINRNHTYSPTYPAMLVVPAAVSDNVLKYGGQYRSRTRIPALSYLHGVNQCSITRSSQPMVGLFKGKRNIQDEKLVAAIFASNRGHQDCESMDESSNGDDEHGVRNKIYGAQQRNLIVDARPVLNARANQATGKGSENMEHYKDASITFLGIDNVHVMRDSLNRVVDALSHTDYTKLPPDQDMLTRSKWLKYIRLLLHGTDLVARQVGINHSHVLIHCSDGWDRTSKISALSQLCLDPYYRTLHGFIVLVEKDWLSFGHMFRRRTGPLASEKWFDVEDDRPKTDSPRAQTNFGTALTSAREFFLKRTEDSDPDGLLEETPRNEEHRTRLEDMSPIFHQFLDATWQLLHQHPTRFEFNERFLKRLLYHLYSAQYGTFLFDCELERVQAKASTRTRSVWDYFFARKEQFLNHRYDPVVDDKVAGQERLLFPDTKAVRWWAEGFGRGDEEMNGTAMNPAQSLPRDEVVLHVPDDGHEDNDPFAGAKDRMIKSLSSISIGARSTPISRSTTPDGRSEKSAELDMQVPAAGQESPSPATNGMSAQAFARDSAFRD